MDNDYAVSRMKEMFESTIESGIKYDGKLDNIDYYSLFCKAAAQEKLFKLIGNNVCMLNCNYNNKDAVLIVFYIPINTEDTGAKNIAERVMKTVDVIEKSLITLDHLKSEEVKEDKFIYVTAIKIINDDD